MLTPIEQQMLDQLMQKQQAAQLAQQPIAPVQNIPQIQQMPDFGSLTKIIDKAIDARMNMKPYAPAPTPQVYQPQTESTSMNFNDEFFKKAAPLLLGALTLPQKGQLFALAMQAGPEKETLFKNAIIGYLQTPSGKEAVQITVDSFLAEVNKAEQQVQPQ